MLRQRSEFGEWLLDSLSLLSINNLGSNLGLIRRPAAGFDGENHVVEVVIMHNDNADGDDDSSDEDEEEEEKEEDDEEEEIERWWTSDNESQSSEHALWELDP